MLSFASRVESSTTTEIGITVTLELKSYDYRYNYEEGGSKWRVVKSYHGKSTRPVKRYHKYPNCLSFEKDEMEKEAKNVALRECFKDHLGISEFKDLAFDELHRPLKEIKLRSKMIK